MKLSKVLQMDRKRCGKKGKNALNVFSKDLSCSHVKARACLGKGHRHGLNPNTLEHLRSFLVAIEFIAIT